MAAAAATAEINQEHEQQQQGIQNGRRIICHETI
jgi:hypothetical protein